ncbi:MAG: MazG nucleotide pyrophosphohydrolase domain-containing protein [Candidatus Paceibacterota bacterium]
MKKLKKSPDLADFQAHIKAVCKERGWDKNSNLVILSGLVEELGELTRAMRDYRGEWEQDGKESKKGQKHHLEREFADVFNYLLDLANYFDVDLEQAYRDKCKINETRKWGEGRK